MSGCATRPYLIKAMSDKGEVLKQYDLGKDHYMIIREGPRVVKYRIYDWATFDQKGTRSEVFYIVDTTTQSCYTGAVEVKCEKLKKDQDMVEHISW